METFSCFRKKEVINICDGQRLGFVCDLEFDECTGRIIRIIVPECGKYLGFFGREREFRIPWQCIKKISNDIILVDVNVETVTGRCGCERC